MGFPFTQRPKSRDLGQAARRTLGFFRQPVCIFGLALIGLLWAGAFALVYQDRAALTRQGARDAANYALVMEQDVAETVNKADRILRLLQWVDKRDNHGDDWAAVLEGEHLVDRDMVQTAVTDARGFMISSSSSPRPAQPLNLSDREHIRVQLASHGDDLFISQVIVGRVSGKKSIQFSRRLIGEAGETLGVLVLSLPAQHFDASLANMDFGEGGGLYVVGDDGFIRAGAGVFRDCVGAPVDQAIERRKGGFVAERRVAGAPLTVVASLPGVEANAEWRFRRLITFGAVALATLAALAATLEVAARRQRYEENLLRISRVDALTQIASRRAFSERLEALCADAPGEFALHLIDLDRFKMVNDSFGHAAGDELLRVASRRLQRLAGPADLVARLGGDEFALLQAIDDYRRDANGLAARLCAAMAEPFALSSATLQIGATVGVALGGVDGADGSALMKAADLALYVAKTAGRGGHQVFTPAMAEAAAARLHIEAGLRTAIAKGELYLDYQPIVATADERVRGFEALLRWRRVDGKTIPPSEFIPVAEDLGLISEIGAWALRRACQEIAALPGDYGVAVNCSPAQFAAADLVATVADALLKSGLAPQRLVIEITESMLMKDHQRILEQLNALRALGVSVSIDDFGAGYSCLSYLEMYPISALKIDRMFVEKIGRSESALDTLRAIVALAESFGLYTVAEGVETAEQLRALNEVGCTAVQGFYCGRPGDLSRFAVVERKTASAA